MTENAAAYNWLSVPLSDVCERTASTNPGSRPDEFFNYVDVSCVSNESFKIVGANRLKGEDAPSRARQLIEHEDVIFATVRPALRRVAMVPPELHREVCSTGFCVLRANKLQLNPRFLYFYLLSEPVRQRVETLQTGATYPAINDGDLLRMEIALPPLPQQQAIADVLATVQKAKEARQRELALEHERKVTLLEEVFTHGTRGEKTTQTEIGEIPESWRLVRLKEVARKITDGTHWTPTYVPEGIPFLRVLDIQTPRIEWERVKRIPPSEHSELIKRCKPENGDVLLSKNGTIGLTKVVDWDNEFSIFVSLCLIKPKSELLDAYFLAEFLSSTGLSQIQKRGKRMTVTNLHLVEIKELLIPLPEVGEQKEIAKALQSCDRVISAAQNEIRILGEFFQALLEELTTGRLSTKQLAHQHHSQ